MDNIMQLLSIAGAALILGAFVALQRRLCRSHDRSYLWANFFGAAFLALVAVWDRRLGFIALEGAWALVSLWSLMIQPARRSA